jgi:trans-aconitate methyltransferase
MATWNARDYSQNSSAQQKWAHELIDKLHLRGDEHVLDIGCGDGKVTAELARRVPGGVVVGIDNSRDMVWFARETFPESTHANLFFLHCDAAAMQFQDQFDVIFSNAALHWIVNHRPVLQGISRALKPKGRILLQMGGRGNAAGVLGVVNGVASAPKWSKFFQDFRFPYGFHGPEDYCDWLAESGLAPQRIELIPKDMIHASIDKFSGWFRTTWMPWIQSVPEDRREEFIETVIIRYLSAHPVDEIGRVHVEMVRLEVEARGPE